MSESLFHEGKLSKLFLREIDGQPARIIKKTSYFEKTHPRNAALFNEFSLLKEVDSSSIRKALAFEAGKEGPELHLEFIDALPLSKAIKQEQGGLKFFLETAIKIARALEEVHRQNIIHKDINPENILFSEKDQSIKIIDFGISGKLDLKTQHLGNPELLEGTLHYMSPEQTGRMDRVLDSRSDIYSLGVTFYELLCGKKPFLGDSALALVHAHVATKAPTLDGQPVAHSKTAEKIPPILDAILAKMMQKNAEDRYKSAHGVRVDLEKCLAQFVENGAIDNFQLGKKDAVSVLKIPEKLYGMNAQIEFLKELFHAVENGENRIALLKGASGVGKSAFARELHKHLALTNGKFISGKFDQLQKNVPHFALVQALNELVELLMSEKSTDLAAWKTHILEALDGLGKVVIDLVPSLENIIGPQPDVPELPTTESQNRREYALRSFIKSLSDLGNPLIIFIDDLQWADEASLDLFKKLLLDKENKGLLFLGAFRDNEVSGAHPLALTIAEIKEEIKVDEIKIENLAVDSVEELLADTLEQPREKITELAALIHQKTKGNAFFVLQFLKSMYQSGVLTFEKVNYTWVWQLEEIDQMKITENVIDLVCAKIEQLPEELIEVLKICACIGNRFDVKTLSAIINKPVAECLALLREAVKQELIFPKSQSTLMMFSDEFSTNISTFYFAHDRIHQAAYQLIEEGEREKVHLKIGKSILSEAPRKTKDQVAIDVCNHVNIAINLLKNEEERLQFAEYNLIAGKRARKASAYQQALTFLEAGISLLPPNAWQNHYDICLPLFLEGAESAYLAGHHNRMEELMTPVLQNGKSILDKMPVYHVKVDAYTAQHQLTKAVEAGVEALEQLGLSFPKNPKLIHVFRGLGATKLKLAGKKVEQLVDLPEMKDPYMLEAMPLMERISPAAYMSGSQLFPLLVFRMVDVSLKYGNSALSAFGYASFAITLSGVLGDYDGGYRFAELSMKLLEKFQNETFKVKVYFVNFCFVRHWKEHAREMVSPLLEAYRSGMQVGNLFSATWVACYAQIWKYYAGYHLDELHQDLIKFGETFRQLKQDGAFNLDNILEKTVAQLKNPEQVSTLLGGNETAENEILERCSSAEDKTAIFFFYLNKMQLAYWFNQTQEALEHIENAKKYLDAVVGLHYIPLFEFYQALICASLALHSRKDLKTVKASLKKMKKWATHAPMNYQHKWQLLQAEYFRITGHENEARQAYDLAIEGARKNGFLQEEAMSYELASKFYGALEINHMAALMRNGAIRAWGTWGANAKLKELKALVATTHDFDGQTLPSSTLQTVSGGTSSLDKESIIKASHILSGEINPEKLVLSFMQVMIENSGADNAVLLLKEKDEWIVKAKVSINQDGVRIINQPVDLDHLDQLEIVPGSVVNYVIHSKNKVLVNNREEDSIFRKDAYINTVQPKSFIGYPLVNKSQLVGVLYLENKLTKGVFHVSRLELLNVLSAQMAVSLENAWLYTNTKQLNVAYERFVPKEFLSFLSKESIIEVQLGDQVQKEMTVMFSDIRGFTALSETLSPQESFNFINDYLSVMEPHITAHGGFIDKYIGDAIMALFPAKPDDAIEATLGMIKELKNFNEQNPIARKYPINFGTGIHTGRLILGTVGAKGRMDSTVISDAVNIAARVENVTKKYQAKMLITESTLQSLQSPGQFKVKKIADEVLKGKTQKQAIYQVEIP